MCEMYGAEVLSLDTGRGRFLESRISHGTGLKSKSRVIIEIQRVICAAQRYGPRSSGSVFMGMAFRIAASLYFIA